MSTETTTLSQRAPRIRLALASILGILSSLAAVYVTIMGRIGGGGGHACVGPPGVDCTVPLTSAGAWLGGIPLAAWAAALFAWVGMWSLRWPAARRFSWERYGLLAVVSVGCAVAAYKTAFSVAVLKAVCVLCLTMALAIAWSLLEAWILVRRASAMPTTGGLSPAGVALSLAVLGVSLGALYWLSHKALTFSGGDVDSLVAAHFSAPRQELPPLDGAAEAGSPAAPVEIVEFLDFDCGYCRAAAESIRALEADHPGMLHRYRVITAMAGSAGRAPRRRSPSALAAAATIDWPGAWDFQRELFAAESLDAILDVAESRGWSRADLERAIAADSAQQVLATHARIAERAGVHAVPTIFVNGRIVRFWMRREVLETVLAAELSRSAPDRRSEPVK